MNSVIAYKQFSLGEGIAELFAPEIKNLETFKKAFALAFKKQSWFMGEYNEGYYGRWDKNDYEKSSHKKSN